VLEKNPRGPKKDLKGFDPPDLGVSRTTKVFNGDGTSTPEAHFVIGKNPRDPKKDLKGFHAFTSS
jgi:hypothetical protein